MQNLSGAELGDSMLEYKDHFYLFLASFAVRSAEQIVPLLSALLPINSVVDFGCGHGAWLSVWRKAGCSCDGGGSPLCRPMTLNDRCG